MYVLWNRKRGVFLLQHCEFVAPEAAMGDVPQFREKLEASGASPSAVEFMINLVQKNGLGERTALPTNMHAVPPDLSHRAARRELEDIFFSVVDEILRKSGLQPTDIDILVTNCSLFNPVPSMASVVVHRYGMRRDIDSYHLGGMGCSANVIAMELAHDLLHARSNVRALILSTEIVTPNWYRGEDKSFLLSNTLFRMGGAGVLLSNRDDDRPAYRYRLLHTLRTTLVIHANHDARTVDCAVDGLSLQATNEDAYRCVFQDLDADNKIGVRLDKNLVKCASRTLKVHLNALGRLILPWNEKLRVVWDYYRHERYKPSVRPNVTAQAVSETCDPTTASQKPAPALSGAPPPYTPNFKTAVDYICIHAGGRAVIDGIKEGLNLTERDVKASRDVLREIGNVSSASIWYEFGRLERDNQIKSGQKIW